MHARKILVEQRILQSQGEGAPLGPHGVGGIGAQIHDDLMQLGGIRHYIGLGLNIVDDFDGGRQGGPHQFEHLFDQKTQFDGLVFWRLKVKI